MKYLFVTLWLGLIFSCGSVTKKEVPVSEKEAAVGPKTEVPIGVKKQQKKKTQPKCEDIEGIQAVHSDSIPEDYTGVVFYCREGMVQLLCNYKDGKKDGLSRRWDDGQLWIEMNYKVGKEDGLYRKWDGYGDLSVEMNYKEGRQEGLERTWHSKGKLRYESNYKNGEEDGLVRWWHRNGQLKHEKTFENGFLEGFDRSWYEDGQMKSECWRVHGNSSKSKHWNMYGERRN